MSVHYKAVYWNPQKRIYDTALAGTIAVYLTAFAGLGALLQPNATIETLLIRGLGTAALLLLHVILCIGPLARLDPRFLPLLYNRRHLGVTMFFLALAHAVFSLVQFHALGNRNILVSVLTANPRYGSLGQFPFEVLGLAALCILFLMAATSHDFWLRNLTAPVWKRLHMLVYLAYLLLIGHVALGVLQDERSPLLAAILATGAAVVAGLHLAAARRETPGDREATRNDGFVPVCAAQDIPAGRAVIACIGGERVAVFRYQGKVSAISNVCQHQNGPLGEGRIVNGCVTCPWHGYEYLPETGASPPPFQEKVPVFRTRVENGMVLVHPDPLPGGTHVEPSVVEDRKEVRRAS